MVFASPFPMARHIWRYQSVTALNVGRGGLSIPRTFISPRFRIHNLPRTHPTSILNRSPVRLLLKTAGISGLALGVVIFTAPTAYCETPPSTPPHAEHPYDNLPSPPVSAVNPYELGFGTVCGVCAGVFVKKGAKAIAFLFGGIFVLLQYLNSKSLIRVNWSEVGSRFEEWFFTPRPDGTRNAPTVYSLWKVVVDFLVADFQQRASFVVGFALGLRLG